MACVTADDFRWQKAHIKSVSLLASVFARQISADAGATETIMFRDGFLRRRRPAMCGWCAAARCWRARDNLVLEGIRYGLIEQLCRDAGIRFTLRRVSRDEVLGADEIIPSSATKEVLPVTRLDGQPVGNGQPGPIYQKLHAGYQRAKQESPHDRPHPVPPAGADPAVTR